MNRIAIIPARSGSKGLVDKNIIDICGKPMIAYSIEAAIESGLFSRVIVSTDSERYKRISERYGAEVIMREAELATDTATTYMVLEDLLTKKIAGDFDYFMLLQPTSPLRTVQNIKEACTLFEKRMNDMDFLASVQKASHPSVLVKEIDDDCTLKNFDIDYSTYRRQAFREYTPNGAIYIAKRDAYLRQKHFYGAKCLAYFMTDVDSVDVDNAVDHLTACYLIAQKSSRMITMIDENDENLKQSMLLNETSC